MSDVDVQLTYDAEDVRRSNARPSLRLTGPNEFIKFKVTGVSKKIAKSGSYMLEEVCAPMDDEGNVRYPTTRNFILLPLTNKTVEKHTPPGIGMSHSYLLATNAKGIEPLARWSSDQRGYVTASGDVIRDKQAANAFNEEMKDKVFARMVELWNNPSQLEGDTFFAQVTVNSDGYRNLTKITGELPGGATLITEDFGVIE